MSKAKGIEDRLLMSVNGLLNVIFFFGVCIPAMLVAVITTIVTCPLQYFIWLFTGVWWYKKYHKIVDLLLALEVEVEKR